MYAKAKMSGKETKNVGLALRVTNARLKRKVANPFVNQKRNMPTAKPRTWEFNLNQVDHAYTQIRVNYRKKESDGGWTSKVYRDWSAKSVCEKGKKYKVYLEL